MVDNVFVLVFEGCDGGFYGGDGFFEALLGFRGKFEFDDSFYTVFSEDDGDSDGVVAASVLAAWAGGDAHDSFAVVDYGVCHHGDDGCWGVDGAAFEFYDVCAAGDGLLGDFVYLLFGEEGGDGDAGDGGVFDEWDHGVAVFADDEGVYVLS